MQQLSWREKFAAILVLLIGIVFLLMQVFALVSSRSNAYSEADGALVISKGELFADIRAYITIFLGIAGGILLWKSKRLGWVIGISLLIFFTLIACYGIVNLVMQRVFDSSFKMVVALAVVLLTAVIFLLLPAAKQKYRVGKRTYLPTLLFFMAIAAVYFFLQ